MQAETIIFEQREHVAWITLNRPEVLNAINDQMQDELQRAWERARDDPEVRAVVLTGSGDRAFSSGADRTRHDAGVTGDPRGTTIAAALAAGAVPGSPGYETHLGERISPKMQNCWKPVIAAVNGLACAGAFYLLGEADIVIAAEHATFFDAHVTYGMVSAYESMYMLQRMPIGEVIRMQLLGNFERMSARRAYEIGLVSEVVPGTELPQAAHWIASRIAMLSPAAVQGTLRAIWAARDIPRPMALSLSPHFIAMANPKDWTKGQETFRSGSREQPRVR